jgi:hypothetical protein
MSGKNHVTGTAFKQTPQNRIFREPSNAAL